MSFEDIDTCIYDVLKSNSKSKIFHGTAFSIKFLYNVESSISEITESLSRLQAQKKITKLSNGYYVK